MNKTNDYFTLCKYCNDDYDTIITVIQAHQTKRTKRSLLMRDIQSMTSNFFANKYYDAIDSALDEPLSYYVSMVCKQKDSNLISLIEVMGG